MFLWLANNVPGLGEVAASETFLIRFKLKVQRNWDFESSTYFLNLASVSSGTARNAVLHFYFSPPFLSVETSFSRQIGFLIDAF